jgi:hypothetical protein
MRSRKCLYLLVLALPLLQLLLLLLLLLLRSGCSDGNLSVKLLDQSVSVATLAVSIRVAANALKPVIS